MYKIFFTACILILFTACSTSQPQTQPLWYTSPPQDQNFFYAVGEADDQNRAQNQALVSLRKSLTQKIITAYKDPKHPLQQLDEASLLELQTGAKHLCNTLEIKNIILEQTQTYKQQTHVLIKVPKQEIYDAVQKNAHYTLESLQTRLREIESKIAIYGYKDLRSFVKEYNHIASSIQLKKLAHTSYAAQEEFVTLKKLRDLFIKYQADISIHLLSDANSIPFVRGIKKSIQEYGLRVSKTPTSKHSLTLLVQSNTRQLMEHNIMQAKTLIEFALYDFDKNKIASQQHILVGKSQTSHLDAKILSSKNLESLLHQKGLFEVLGLSKQ